MERTELNSNEKLALTTTGMEGTGEHFIMNGESADRILMNEKASKFNSAVDSYVDKFDKHRQELENYAQTLSEDIGGLEIMPMFAYALIQPFEKNPFQQIKISEGGIITDVGGLTHQYKSKETQSVCILRKINIAIIPSKTFLFSIISLLFLFIIHLL